jgi:ATP-binding cassette subfamily F protein 3
MSVYYVHQEVTLTEAQEVLTPVQHVLAADVERRMLLQEQARLAGSEDMAEQERLATVEARLETIGSSQAERRVVELLTHLGFSDEFRARPMHALSGGWRVRTALAAALFAKPDVLLLDEPTNHLSIDAVMWLTRELSTSATWDSRIVVVVSHDRRVPNALRGGYGYATCCGSFSWVGLFVDVAFRSPQPMMALTFRPRPFPCPCAASSWTRAAQTCFTSAAMRGG